MTLVTGTAEDIGLTPDNSLWMFSSPLRESSDGEGLITPKWARRYPVDGVISIELDPGPAVINYRGIEYQIEVPESGTAKLKDLIAAEIAFPTGTPPQLVGNAVDAYLDVHPLDWDDIDKPPVIAEGDTQAAARSAIDAFSATQARKGVPAASRAERAIASFTFDDGGSEDMSVILPILNAQGIKGGFCWYTSVIGGAGRATYANGRTLQAAGHEIIAHSVTHPTPFTSQTEAQMLAEINDSYDALTAQGIDVRGFVYPGNGNNALARSIARAKYTYALGDGGSNAQPVTTYALPRFKIEATTLWSAIQAYIDAGIASKSFMVFYCHPHNGTEYTSTTTTLLNQAIDYLQAASVPIVTPSEGFGLVGNVVDVGDYLSGSGTAVSASGKLLSTGVAADLIKVVTGSGAAVTAAMVPNTFTAGKMTYHFTSAANNTDWPVAAAIATTMTNLLNSATGFGYVFQYFWTETRSFIRRSNSGGTAWGAWTELTAAAGTDHVEVTAGGSSHSAATAPSGYTAGKITVHSTPGGSNTDWPITAVTANVVTTYLLTSSYTYMLQQFYASNRMFQRRATSSSVWGSWTEVGGGAAGSTAAAMYVAPTAYESGSYYLCNSQNTSSTSVTLSNARVRTSQWLVAAPLTISALVAELTAAGDANSVFRIGIWNDDGYGRPGTLLLDAGTISTGSGNAGSVATGGTAGAYEIAASITLQPGVYHVGGAVQGVTTTQPTMRTIGGVATVPFTGPITTSLALMANAVGLGWYKDTFTGAFSNISSPLKNTSSSTTAARIGYKAA